MTLAVKERQLCDIIAGYESAIVALSGGVDSALLAVIAYEVLGENMLLVTARSSFFAAHELEDARAVAETRHIRHAVIDVDDAISDDVRANTPERCYLCKKALFSRICAVAKSEHYPVVFDGGNRDDIGDYRPGRRALAELGVVSPLCDADLGKEEIRALSRKRNLPTADKPSCACLASRFPYGERIDNVRLHRVERAEEAIRALGFSQVRVRVHGDCARVELDCADLDRGWIERERIAKACKNAGFAFVALDTRGYRTGALNEPLARDYGRA